MLTFETIIGFVAGFLVCGVLSWIIHRRSVQAHISRATAELANQVVAISTRLESEERERAKVAEQLADSQQQNSTLQSTLHQEISTLREDRARLETSLIEEQRKGQEKLRLIEEAQVKLGDAFKALSAEALKSNNESFLALASGTFEKLQITATGDLEKREKAIEQLVNPMREALSKFDQSVSAVEKSRVGAYENLIQQVRGLQELHHQLRGETTNLVRALGTPRVRGRWGEIQLKRVVEMAGMLEYCDFKQQQSVTDDDGSRLRPDLVISVPGGKQIVVDAKAPLAAYLEAHESQDDGERKVKLATHARHIRDHLTQLGRKTYWDQFQPSPELVVMFIPGEGFLSAALESDPSLIETGVNERVVIASPMTLIALLRSIAFGWRQESLAENAQKISDLGRDLYKRLGDLGGHFDTLGKRLSGAVESYNQAVGSLETRVLTQARKFNDYGIQIADREIGEVRRIEISTRAVQSPELLSAPPETPTLASPPSEKTELTTT